MQLRFTVVALGERARFPPGLAGGLLNNNRARMVTSNNIRLQIPVGNATPQRRKSISATTSYHPSSSACTLAPSSYLPRERVKSSRNR